MQGLKEARQRLNLTQKQAAEAVGITQNYYNELENGKKQNPTQKVILGLSSVMHCSIDELYKGAPKTPIRQNGKQQRKRKGKKGARR